MALDRSGFYCVRAIVGSPLGSHRARVRIYNIACMIHLETCGPAFGNARRSVAHHVASLAAAGDDENPGRVHCGGTDVEIHRSAVASSAAYCGAGNHVVNADRVERRIDIAALNGVSGSRIGGEGASRPAVHVHRSAARLRATGLPGSGRGGRVDAILLILWWPLAGAVLNHEIRVQALKFFVQRFLSRKGTSISRAKPPCDLGAQAGTTPRSPAATGRPSVFLGWCLGWFDPGGGGFMRIRGE